MLDVKFRAMYPKEGDDNMNGYALLEDGTLVKLVSNGNGLVMTDVEIEDKTTPRKRAWT